MAKHHPRRCIQGIAPRASTPRGRLRERVTVSGSGAGDRPTDTEDTEDARRRHRAPRDGPYTAFRVSTKDPK